VEKDFDAVFLSDSVDSCSSIKE